MKIVARAPTSRAAHATAWPWFPALAATTFCRSSGKSVAILFTAPRILKEPVRWRFSALSHTERPTRRPIASEELTGVTRAIPSIRARAASMSARVGAIFVGIAVRVDVEHLLHDLSHRGQRVELPPLDLVEQASKLGVVRDRALQVQLCPRARDREHLA